MYVLYINSKEVRCPEWNRASLEERQAILDKLTSNSDFMCDCGYTYSTFTTREAFDLYLREHPISSGTYGASNYLMINFYTANKIYDDSIDDYYSESIANAEWVYDAEGDALRDLLIIGEAR